MMNSRLQARVKDHLDMLMADIRPQPSERKNHDLSYRLSEALFIIEQQEPHENSNVTTSTPLVKVLHLEEPEAWALYVLSDESNWQAYETVSTAPDLAQALVAVRSIIASKAAKLLISDNV
jgi:hypothetical protein